MRHDVIVVGAGPAGSTVARECAARGLSVILVDKAEFPRDKPCGGGVNVRAARLLPFDLTEVVERTIHGMEIRVHGSRRIRRYATSPITYMTRRRRLDAFLVERAIAHGVTLRQRAPVREVTEQRGGYCVRAGREEIVGRVLVAADGANGRTAALAGIVVDRHRGIAMEAHAPLSPQISSRYADALGVDLGTVPGGFGWLFAKSDHVNIGVGGWLHEAPTLRGRLAALARGYGVDPCALQHVRAHLIPVRKPGSPLARGSAVVVGDAAGFVDPLSGEGIYAAILSGRLAAEHVVMHLGGCVRDLDGYRRAIEADLERELSLGLVLHDLVQLAPGAQGVALEHADLLWDFGFRLLQGQLGLRDVRDRLGAAWPVVVAASRVGGLMRAYRHWQAGQPRGAAPALDDEQDRHPERGIPGTSMAAIRTGATIP